MSPGAKPDPHTSALSTLSWRFSLPRRPDPTKSSSLAQSATGAAAEAYAVALLGLAGVRQPAKEFYLATATVEFALEANSADSSNLIAAWRAAFEKLEAAVVQEADGLQAQG